MRLGRFSRQSYDAALGMLQREAAGRLAAGEPEPDVVEDYERAEFNLTLQSRIARELSFAERDALWRVRQDAAAKRQVLAARMIAGEISEAMLFEGMQQIASSFVADLRKILPPDDVRAYLGEEGGALPLEREPAPGQSSPIP